MIRPKPYIHKFLSQSEGSQQEIEIMLRHAGGGSQQSSDQRSSGMVGSSEVTALNSQLEPLNPISEEPARNRRTEEGKGGGEKVGGGGGGGEKVGGGDNGGGGAPRVQLMGTVNTAIKPNADAGVYVPSYSTKKKKSKKK